VTLTTPAARQLLPADDDRDEWLAARRAGVTASEIAMVLGVAPKSWGGPWVLYQRKTGALPEPEQTPAMAWGHIMEAPLEVMFATSHPEWAITEGGLWQNLERPWQMATPDRLLRERIWCDACDSGSATAPCTCAPFAVLEFKANAVDEGGKWGDEYSDEVPLHYYCQVQWQMDTLGLKDACIYVPPGGGPPREYWIPYDERDCITMRAAAQDFLQRIENEDPPPVDHYPATTLALKAIHPDIDDREAEIPAELAGMYRLACEKASQWKVAKELAENEIRDAIGPAKTATCDGEKVATRSKSSRKGYTVEPTTIDRLTPAGKKKGK
jgi:putative phage-type endonuclease